MEHFTKFDCNSSNIMKEINSKKQEAYHVQNALNKLQNEVTILCKNINQMVKNQFKEILKEIEKRKKLINEWMIYPVESAANIIKDINCSSFYFANPETVSTIIEDILNFNNRETSITSELELEIIELKLRIENLVKIKEESDKESLQKFAEFKMKLTDSESNTKKLVSMSNAQLADLIPRFGTNWSIHLDFVHPSNVAFVQRVLSDAISRNNQIIGIFNQLISN